MVLLGKEVSNWRLSIQNVEREACTLRSRSSSLWTSRRTYRNEWILFRRMRWIELRRILRSSSAVRTELFWVSIEVDRNSFYILLCLWSCPYSLLDFLCSMLLKVLHPCEDQITRSWISTIGSAIYLLWLTDGLSCFIPGSTFCFLPDWKF